MPPDDRIGYAIVGVGRLSLNQILPAPAQCKYSKVAALVSGDRTKALRVARQYGVPEADIHDYQIFERLADNPRVQVVSSYYPTACTRNFRCAPRRSASTCFAKSRWRTASPIVRQWSTQ
ncbi:Gfo/Idh/MocA family oxidoreductase [Caballeronia sp. LZ029]|nr:Gfo/Idh/MocA family oxidoreductase [Caballeronia sp. LZ029]MDR5744557.1 Gfo/Idh/MocA family oxidoreductase [Caballeronia sp. LZ029]